MTESVFDQEFPKYVARGFNVHPIKAKSKAPGFWNPHVGATVLLTGWTVANRQVPKPPQPQCGIGILLGPQPNGINLLAMDWDDDEIANLALERFPSPIMKWGRRGFTAFYRCAQPVPSRKYRIGDRQLGELLCVGMQTVLPPTIHPDTGRPYVWENVA